MAMQYVLGVDYGTLSCRVIVANAQNGQVMGACAMDYPHGVMERALPDGTPLSGADWALQHPRDYWDTLVHCVPGALKSAGVRAQDVFGLALSPTACTLMPVDAQLRPLCFDPAFSAHPHAYVKLWKHHRAQRYADQMTEAALARGEKWLPAYGGKISSEWAQPKMLEVYAEDRAVYDQADRFMQFSSWIEALLTGESNARGGGVAAFKALRPSGAGFPSDNYFAAVHPELTRMVHEKLRGTFFAPGARIGSLTADMAARLGLCPGIAVGAGHTDAHCAAYGVGVCDEGDSMMVLGTSLVTHFISTTQAFVPGVGAAMPDGLVPGFTCYTAGQPCAGDMLDWFLQNALPGTHSPAEAHAQLTRLAAAQSPGECGLLALDWWGGNRSPLANSALSGALIGLTMNTRPHDIYRALLDGIALDQRLMRDHYAARGLHVKRTVACGGMANKNPLLMQILSDVLNAPIEISSAAQASALGAAMCAATAAGAYSTLQSAIRTMRAGIAQTVRPDSQNAKAYLPLYRRYRLLYEFFGREHPQIMAELKR